MAKSISIQSSSLTMVLNGITNSDLFNGDAVTLTYPNEKTSHTNGVNDSIVVKSSKDGDVAEVTINVLKLGDFDVFLNTEFEKEVPTIFNGSIKRNFVKDGTDGTETISLSNGTATKKPDATFNTKDGDELMAYTFRFRAAKRFI